MTPFDVDMVEPVGSLATGAHDVQPTLGISPSFYTLDGGVEDFDSYALFVLRSWRTRSPVRVTVRGTEILHVGPA